MLDYGKPFFSANTILGSDGAPLLVLAKFHAADTDQAYQTPDKLALLLSRGADVYAHDDNGDTCLHIVMQYDRHREISGRVFQNTVNATYDGELKDILLLLMTAGADVYARNNNGKTPSEIARFWNQEREWREALEECGYDPDEVENAEEKSVSRSSGTDFAETPLQRPFLSFAEYLERRKGRLIEELSEEESESEVDVNEDDMWESWETGSNADGESQELEGYEHSQEEQMQWKALSANAAGSSGGDDLKSQTAMFDAYRASKDKLD